jgi:aspartyl-tRNA(Asn)/glutamyl-tRNA(Gln) amidotransferase subunit C
MRQTLVTLETVRHLAHLSALTLTQEEENRLSQDLERILEYMEHLASLDTEGLEATFQIIPLSNVWREDEPAVCLSQDLALQNASEKENGFFKMPPILE